MFGALYSIRRERGLEPFAEVAIPHGGRVAEDIALELELPVDKIEGVFVNHVVRSIDYMIQPGDEVAFIPTGVPGPYRFMLGIRKAGERKNKD